MRNLEELQKQFRVRYCEDADTEMSGDEDAEEEPAGGGALGSQVSSWNPFPAIAGRNESETLVTGSLAPSNK